MVVTEVAIEMIEERMAEEAIRRRELNNNDYKTIFYYNMTFKILKFRI